MVQDNKVALSNSLRAIASVIEDIRHGMKETDTRVKNMGVSLDNLETELKRQLTVQERTNREMQKLKNEMEYLKTEVNTRELSISTIKNKVTPVCSFKDDVESVRLPLQVVSRIETESQEAITKMQEASIETQVAGSAEGNRHIQTAGTAVMQGSGFSHITLEYLKKLAEK